MTETYLGDILVDLGLFLMLFHATTYILFLLFRIINPAMAEACELYLGKAVVWYEKSFDFFLGVGITLVIIGGVVIPWIIQS